MSRKSLILFAVVVMHAGLSASGQLYDPGQSYFEPTIELDEYSARSDDGLFFNYDRLIWAYHSERPTVGSETAIRRAGELTWGPGNAGANIGGIVDADGDGVPDFVLVFDPPPTTFNPVDRPIVRNGLNEIYNRPEFEMGDRFEFGVRRDGDEWFTSIISPLDITQDENFGIGITGQDDTANVPGVPGSNLLPGGPLQAASPFGSVLILFDYDEGLMDGFLDVYDGVIVGNVPGDILEDDSNLDGILDGDGLADDINHNSIHGPDGADVLAPGNIPETDIDAIDFGDLVELPTSWQTVNIRSILETAGAEFMGAHQLQSMLIGRTGLHMLYGIRYLRFKDTFSVFGQGGVLGDSFWDTEIRNQLIGPQLGCRWVKNNGRFGVTVDGRAFMAVNVEDWEQDVAMGEDLIPSQHNHPLYFYPTVAHHAKREFEFAPMGELRVTGSYQITKGMALNVGYNGMFVDGIRRASTHIKYRLPDMGFVEGQRENIFLSGLNLGVSFTH